MEKFKELIIESAISFDLQTVMKLKKECSNKVPVRVKRFDVSYDTSTIAQMLLDGGYHLINNKEESIIISAEDVAKVPGFIEAIQVNMTQKEKPYNQTTSVVKIGRKSLKFSLANENYCYAAAHIMTVNGEVTEKITKNKIDSDIKNEIKNGVVVMAMRTPLSQAYVDGWFPDPEEKQGFYVQPAGGREFYAILRSADKLKGTDGPFVIFGQQHATKGYRFMWVNYTGMLGGYFKNVRYEKMSYRQMSTPRSYSKGALQDRSDGIYVAK